MVIKSAESSNQETHPSDKIILIMVTKIKGFSNKNKKQYKTKTENISFQHSFSKRNTKSRGKMLSVGNEVGNSERNED